MPSKKSRTILSLISWLVIAQPSFAQSIRLNPMPGMSAVDRQVAVNVTGTCGGAIVRVLGIERSNDNTYSVDFDAGSVIVRNTVAGERKELMLGAFLSDHNGIACLSGSAGVRLLLWSTCGGSSCPDAYNFRVIDPITVRDLTQTEDCDGTCAARLTGDDLPLRLNAQN